MNNKDKITFTFNIVLFAFYIFSIVLGGLHDPNMMRNSAMDNLFEKHPTITIIGNLIALLIWIFGGTKIIQMFWNRLLCDIFNIRSIKYNECLSINLILCIFTGSFA